MPRNRFDTDYVETRRVHNIVPFISVDGSRYSVPTNVLGQKVEIRRPVDSNRFEVRWAGKIVATHTLVAETHVDVWDPAHRHQAETVGHGRHSPTGRRCASSPTPSPRKNQAASSWVTGSMSNHPTSLPATRSTSTAAMTAG